MRNSWLGVLFNVPEMTVRWEIESLIEIWRLVRPRATRSATCSSRVVRATGELLSEATDPSTSPPGEISASERAYSTASSPVPPLLVLHLGQQLGEAHVESSGCLVEVDDAHVGLAPLDAPTKSCGRRAHQAE